MTTGTLTLTAFLLARIAEDEAAARSLGFATEPKPGDYLYDHALSDCDAHYHVGTPPARVLAECEAHRQIVERCIAEPYDCGKAHPTMDVYHPGGHADEDPTLRALAAVYADHPDYDEAWRP